MSKNIGTDDMRKKMGEILDCVYLRGDEFIIKRKNKQLAALIPVPKLMAIQSSARAFLSGFMKEQKSKISEKEVDEIVKEARKQVRKGKRK